MKKTPAFFFALFVFSVITLGACLAEAANTRDVWRLLDDAQTDYDKGDFGSSLKLCEEARIRHEAIIDGELSVLDESMLPSEVRKKGDDISAVREVLEKRNDYDAVAVIDAVLLNKKAEDFDNSMSRLKEWLEERKVYPEADYLTARVYEAEAENDIAFSFYEKAWKNRAFLDIPDQSYDIVYKMADLARVTGNPGAQEKYLLLVLKEDSLFGQTDEISPTLRAMIRTLETEPTTQKFFSLYRHSQEKSLKASRDLSSFYLEKSRYDRAFSTGIITACVAVTLLSNAVKERDFSFEYSNLSDLMRKAGSYGDIAEWARAAGIWDSLLVFADSLYFHGLRNQSLLLLSEISVNCPDASASRRSEKMGALRRRSSSGG